MKLTKELFFSIRNDFYGKNCAIKTIYVPRHTDDSEFIIEPGVYVDNSSGNMRYFGIQIIRDLTNFGNTYKVLYDAVQEFSCE